jgi:nitrite reductase/ring-hydroxylating ferredoxin subunit
VSLRLVARTIEFTDSVPILAEIDETVVAVYRFKGEYYAYVSLCPHQGGPACEGVLIGNVECEIANGKAKERVSDKNYNVTCPWHGVEFDLETGICLVNKDWRLLRYEVVIQGDQVMIKR